MEKTYIAFDEKPAPVMEKLMSFLDRYAQDFRIALAANTRSDLFNEMDDLSLAIPFNEQGVAEKCPAARCAGGDSTRRTTTTFYVCCGPAFPNTFVFSPLVESRMLPFLAAQGGFDGFLRWAYNSWPADPPGGHRVQDSTPGIRR